MIAWQTDLLKWIFEKSKVYVLKVSHRSLSASKGWFVGSSV